MIDSICHTSTKFAVSVDEGKGDFLNSTGYHIKHYLLLIFAHARQRNYLNC